MEPWQIALLAATLAFAGSVFAMAVKSPKKFIVLANAAKPVLEHLLSASAGFTVGASIAGKFWSGFALTGVMALFGLRAAAGAVAEHLIRAGFAEKSDERAAETDEGGSG